MQRIAQTFGSYLLVGGLESLVFTIPATASVGDQLVILIARAGAVTAAPDGWTLEEGEQESAASASRYGALYSKTCDQDDLDAGSVSLTEINTSVIGGVLVVYRGGLCPVIAEGGLELTIDPFKVKYTASATTLSTFTLTGPNVEDRRLALWLVSPGSTITEASGSKITSLGQATDATTSYMVTAAEYVAGQTGTTGTMSITTSGLEAIVVSCACLRASALLRSHTKSLSAVDPGHIGLVT